MSVTAATVGIVRPPKSGVTTATTTTTVVTADQLARTAPFGEGMSDHEYRAMIEELRREWAARVKPTVRPA